MLSLTSCCVCVYAPPEVMNHNLLDLIMYFALYLYCCCIECSENDKVSKLVSVQYRDGGATNVPLHVSMSVCAYFFMVNYAVVDPEI